MSRGGFFYSVCVWLHIVLDVPHEGSYSELFLALVQFVDGSEELLDLVVVDDSYECGVHLRPCVRAVSWLTVLRASSLHLLPESVSSDAEFIEHVEYLLCVGLIIYYKNCFCHVLLVYAVIILLGIDSSVLVESVVHSHEDEALLNLGVLVSLAVSCHERVEYRHDDERDDC